MNIETEISRLLVLAEPLRSISEDNPAHLPLAGIVDEINRLRAMQADGLVELPAARNKPGPKPKAKLEGADA
jgi:hypothetical protein